MKKRFFNRPTTALALACSVLFTAVQVEGTPKEKNQADHAKQMQECMEAGKSHEQYMAEHKKMHECMEAGKSHEQCMPGMQSITTRIDTLSAEIPWISAFFSWPSAC